MSRPETAVTSRELRYHDGDLPLTGELLWDESADGPRPGVLLVHGGAGLDDHARQQARRYAGLGFTVLAGCAEPEKG